MELVCFAFSGTLCNLFGTKVNGPVAFIVNIVHFILGVSSKGPNSASMKIFSKNTWVGAMLTLLSMQTKIN